MLQRVHEDQTPIGPQYPRKFVKNYVAYLRQLVEQENACQRILALVGYRQLEATLTDAQASDLMAGKWYFNIHTAANKGGEIRGQVTK